MDCSWVGSRKLRKVLIHIYDSHQSESFHPYLEAHSSPQDFQMYSTSIIQSTKDHNIIHECA